MNIHVDTLEYTNMLVKAGMDRPQAEAVAKLQAMTVKDLIDHELVTKDTLASEIGKSELRLRDDIRGTEAKLREEIRGSEAKLREEIRGSEAKLREEIREEATTLRRQMDAIMAQIRALQVGAAIAAFAVSAVVLLSRLIR